MNRALNYILVIVAIVGFSSRSMAVNIIFNGVGKQVIHDTPPASTGLDAVYTVYDISEVSSIEFTNISSPSDFSVKIYSNLGGGYGVEQPVSISGGKALIRNPRGDVGYIVEDGSKRECFWVVDYAEKMFDIQSVSEFIEQDCDMTKISVEGKGEQIKYYSIDGRQCVLSRGIEMNYETLEWDSESKEYIQIAKTQVLEYLQNPITVRPPFYCNTVVEIKGDRFLKTWGLEKTKESSTIHPNGIAVQTEAVQVNTSESEGGSNLIKSEGTMLGGSAPAEFNFEAHITDAVMHCEWQIADDPEFEYIRYRFNEQNLSYVFNEEGKYYVRFVGSNGDGSCESIGETYDVGIGASDLRIPNAFSPDGDGINDEWKVGYRSLVEFKCWIFDRNGQQLYFFDKPDGGWDGKYRGKTMSPGVYYYVIEAKGADGKKYKKGGDINIIRYKKIGNGVGTTPQ